MQDIGSSENAEEREEKSRSSEQKSAKKQTFDLRVQEKGHRTSRPLHFLVNGQVTDQLSLKADKITF